MLRQRLISTAASLPILLCLGTAALAETTVSTERTSQIATATANGGAADDVTIAAAGSIKLSAAGVAALLNSNNRLTNSGSITFTGFSDSTALLANAGLTATLENLSVISLVEDFTGTDADSDGDIDGLFAQGSNRYGMRLASGGIFTGNVTQGAAGSITVEGNSSFGISLESDLVGNFTHRGSSSVIGNTSAAIQVLGDITGSTRIEGALSALGSGSSAASILGDLNGSLTVQGSMIATGYRYTSRPSAKAVRDILDADDLLQGGSALRIAGNVSGGILFDIPPTDASTTDADEDDDGVTDTAEGTASIVTYGSAPAVHIGSDTQAITVGTYGTSGFGLVQRGSIVAGSIFDGVTATGLQIGGTGGFGATITDGIQISGAISSSTFEAASTAVRLTAGASTPRLNVGGTIIASATSDAAGAVTALQIDNAASLVELNVTGIMSAGIAGEAADAYAVRDQSGTLARITNSGRIATSRVPTDDALDLDDSNTDSADEVITGKTIALDLAANTSGVSIIQNGINDGDDGADGVADADADADGVDDADEPLILGDIRLGAGADTLDIRNGRVLGDLSFGAGADQLVVNGGATLRGAISDSDGALSIDLASGTLTNTSTQALTVTSLNIGATSSLIVTADPTSNAISTITAGSASLVTGAKIGVNFTSLLPQTTRYTIIQATSLTAGTLDQSLLGNSPYLYVTSASADTSAGAVYLDVRRRTATEIGLNPVQTSALDAVYAALGQDTGLRDQFLAQQAKNGFINLYDQMVPDQGESVLASLDLANRSITQAISNRPDPRKRYGPDSFWIQEINARVERDPENAPESEAATFGFVGGYESMGDGGALGLTLAYVNVEERGHASNAGEQTTASNLSLGAYWRGYRGNWIFSARGSGGYAWLEANRRLIATSDSNSDGILDTTVLTRLATSDWTGWTGNAGASASYEWRKGKIYVRPGAAIDYLYFSEGDRTENGGGAGFDLSIDSRTSSRLVGSAMISVGAEFGRDLWWRPEFRLGYRQNLAGELGDTVARFSSGNPFTLTSGDEEDGAILAGFSLKAGTPMSYLALEGDAEIADSELRYLIQLYGRMMF